MAEICYVEPIKHVHGKIGKDAQVGFATRSKSGKNYAVRYGKRTKPVKAGELAARDRFKQAAAATKLRMQDASQQDADVLAFGKQSKYTTMRGFIFAQEYAKLG